MCNLNIFDIKPIYEKHLAVKDFPKSCLASGIAIQKVTNEVGRKMNQSGQQYRARTKAKAGLNDIRLIESKVLNGIGRMVDTLLAIFLGARGSLCIPPLCWMLSIIAKHLQ